MTHFVERYCIFIFIGEFLISFANIVGVLLHRNIRRLLEACIRLKDIFNVNLRKSLLLLSIVKKESH